MDAERELAPCPFCGDGEYQITENGRTWTGIKWGEPASVSVRHWCTPIEGQPSRMIERVGRDRASAIAAWNRRPAVEAAAREAVAAPDLHEAITGCTVVPFAPDGRTHSRATIELQFSSWDAMTDAHVAILDYRARHAAASLVAAPAGQAQQVEPAAPAVQPDEWVREAERLADAREIAAHKLEVAHTDPVATTEDRRETQAAYDEARDNLSAHLRKRVAAVQPKVETLTDERLEFVLARAHAERGLIGANRTLHMMREAIREFMKVNGLSIEREVSASGETWKAMADEYQRWIDFFHAGEGDYNDFLRAALASKEDKPTAERKEGDA